MSSCLSLTALRNWCIRTGFSQAGLRPTTADLGDGTLVHCWIPKAPADDSKPNLVLIHGFGANALWQWIDVVPRFTRHFNVYVPDLLFFGGSLTSRPDRSDSFQAVCVKQALDAHSGGPVRRIRKLSVVGLSYGGFVAYRMAALYKEEVERLVICCAAVCMEDDDLENGVLRVSDLEAAAAILVPRTPEKLRELMGFTLYKPPKIVPNCFLTDFIQVMCSDFVEERRDLLRAILKGRKISQIPKINQPTLIIWGDQDRIFPLELAHRLERHLGNNAQLVVLKNAGHAFNVERSREFCQHLKGFLIDSSFPVKQPNSSPMNHLDVVKQ